MLIKSCFACEFHEVRQEGNEKMSRCIKENCYSEFSKCIATKALDRFLEQDSSEKGRPFSAIDQFYPLE